MKQEREVSELDVLRRMLATPPEPRKAKDKAQTEQREYKKKSAT